MGYLALFPLRSALSLAAAAMPMPIPDGLCGAALPYVAAVCCGACGVNAGCEDVPVPNAAIPTNLRRSCGCMFSPLYVVLNAILRAILLLG